MAAKSGVETQYPDADALIDALLTSVRHLLQSRLIGLYLYGSLAGGDFEPEISDIDLLAVTASTLSDAEFNLLNEMHLRLAREFPSWDDRVEVAYYSVDAFPAFRTERTPIAVISPGEPLHFRDNGAGKEWLQNWYLVRETAVTVFGIPPKKLIPPIAVDEFVDAVRKYALECIEKSHSLRMQAYAVLTVCRALHVRQDQRQPSKREAALWVRSRWPQWSGAIDSALAWRAKRTESGTVRHAGDTDMEGFLWFGQDQLLNDP